MFAAQSGALDNHEKMDAMFSSPSENLIASTRSCFGVVSHLLNSAREMSPETFEGITETWYVVKAAETQPHAVVALYCGNHCAILDSSVIKLPTVVRGSKSSEVPGNNESKFVYEWTQEDTLKLQKMVTKKRDDSDNIQIFVIDYTVTPMDRVEVFKRVSLLNAVTNDSKFVMRQWLDQTQELQWWSWRVHLKDAPNFRYQIGPREIGPRWIEADRDEIDHYVNNADLVRAAAAPHMPQAPVFQSNTLERLALLWSNVKAFDVRSKLLMK